MAWNILELEVVPRSQNLQTGLGLRLGTWLLERELTPKFARCGTHQEGCGGTWEQAYYQGMLGIQGTGHLRDRRRYDLKLVIKQQKVAINTA